MKIYLVMKQSNWFDIHGNRGVKEIHKAFSDKKIADSYAKSKDSRAKDYEYTVKAVEVHP
jgi:hypothetical protein